MAVSKGGPLAAQPVDLRLLAGAVAVTLLAACTAIDPGSNFVVSDQTFSEDYFYCHVEPEFLMANHCGAGDAAKGDAPNSCHFHAAAVTGMVLADHPAVNCAGGEHPIDATQTNASSPARSNFEAASFEMTRVYQNAPIFVRPSGHEHPRSVFDSADPTVNQILAAWASK